MIRGSRKSRSRDIQRKLAVEVTGMSKETFYSVKRIRAKRPGRWQRKMK